MKRAIMCAITVTALGLSGCGLRTEKPDGSGTIECTQVRVAPEVGGRVAQLLVDEGAAVKQDDVIARLDATPYAG